MFNVGVSEGILLLVLGLIFLKPDQFSQTARWLGQHLREARKMGNSFKQALMNDSDLKEFRETAQKAEEALKVGKNALREAASLDNYIDTKPAEKVDSTSAEPAAETSSET